MEEQAPWGGYILGIESSSGLQPGGPPVIGGLTSSVFRTGDTVRLDGKRGVVDLDQVQETRVVTSFLERDDGRILLLRRSSAVGSFQGRWAGVSGFLEDPTTEGQARREIREETGIVDSELTLACTGRIVYARDGGRVFSIAPFRFLVRDPMVHLDWEHSEFAWIIPGELERYSTVPQLDRVWRAVTTSPRERPRPNP